IHYPQLVIITDQFNDFELCTLLNSQIRHLVLLNEPLSEDQDMCLCVFLNLESFSVTLETNRDCNEIVPLILNRMTKLQGLLIELKREEVLGASTVDVQHLLEQETQAFSYELIKPFTIGLWMGNRKSN
ncbi:unnamed protein product, partial [Didymodactylos carnosus]